MIQAPSNPIEAKKDLQATRRETLLREEETTFVKVEPFEYLVSLLVIQSIHVYIIAFPLQQTKHMFEVVEKDLFSLQSVHKQREETKIP